MATSFLSLSRSVFTSKQALASFLSRSYTIPSTSLCVSQLFPVRLRPLAAVAHIFHGVSPASLGGFRAFSTRQTQSSLNDSSPNWSNRPPKETILLDGCDFEHWLVVMEKPDDSMTRDDIIDMYIKTLAQVVGSVEEARMKIYSVSTKHYFAFGALVSEELSYKLKELPKVRWVLPDSYLDVKNKDYGGEPFINGQAVPYDPKYHEEWVRNNAKAMERNRRNDRPRNFDRSRNFERRRQNIQNPGMAGPPQGPPSVQMAGNMGGGSAPNTGGMPPNNTGGMPPNNTGGMPPNNRGGMPPNNGGGMPPNNRGGMPPNNMGGMPPNNMGGMPPNIGGMPPNNMGGMPTNNMGGMPPNMGGMPPNNMGGMPHNNMGGMPPNNMGGMPHNNMGGAPHMGGAAPNMDGSPYPGGMHPNNMGGAPNMGGHQNSGWRGNTQNFQGGGFPPHQNSQGSAPNFENYGPNNMGGPAPGGSQYQARDMPPPPPPRDY